MSGKPSLLWFRLDLRLSDNPALDAAVRRGGPVVPVFIWAPDEEGDWAQGAASRWWLHHSLASLAGQVKTLGAPLILRRGPTASAVLDLARETGADAIYWNRRYEPALIARDSGLEGLLRATGIQTKSFNAALLYEPWTIKNSNGKPFQVFSAFWRAGLERGQPAIPLPAPRSVPGLRKRINSLDLATLGLEPKSDWAAGIRSAWRPGTLGATAELNRFLGVYHSYAKGRDRPDLSGTSRLSPHLHFGEISPRQVWQEVNSLCDSKGLEPDLGTGSFLTELGWREFAHYLLYHFPRTPTEPLREQFARFPWRDNPQFLRAWQQGQTGYPLVDAGMRQLWATGWMHNRVRMVVASFLVKNLLVPWQEGARWFWDTLVDADLANNTLGWQWTAGCGADAAPYFRIFNPVLQGEKFDPEGDYIRRWVPELGTLRGAHIHKPWTAPAGPLREAGIRLGETYPEPLISLLASRETALAAYARLKRRKPTGTSGTNVLTIQSHYEAHR